MKQVLIITYYWPPSGGSGVQRWLKFTKYLPEFGWAPTVVTPENPSFINQDKSLLKEVGQETEVLRLPIWEPYGLTSIFKGKSAGHQKELKLTTGKSFVDEAMLWLRGNLLIPDPRLFWVKPVYRFLKSYIQERKIDVIITTGPPHSIHLTGLKLKKKLGVKWVADFRDPWTQWDILDTFKLTNFARNRHRKLEKKVFEYADRVITVGDTMNDGFKKIGADEPVVITNGYDHNDFNLNIKRIKNDVFTIRHIGTIDDLRDPRPFFKQIRILLDEGKKIKVEFIGNINPATRQFIDEYNLGKEIKLINYVPHHQIVEYFQSTDLLLLILANTHSSKLNITGKIFEYMASGCSILGIGNEEGDAARIISSTATGKVIEPDKGDEIRNFLLDAMSGNNPQPIKSEIQKFSRKNLTVKLAEILDEMAGTS